MSGACADNQTAIKALLKHFVQVRSDEYLRVDVAELMREDADGIDLRAIWYRCRGGELVHTTERHAMVTVPGSVLRRANYTADKGLLVDAVRDAVDRLVRLVRPQEFPPFRIRTRHPRRHRPRPT